MLKMLSMGFPGSSDGKESVCNAGDLGLTPWLGSSPWRRERLPTPVFWPGDLHGLYSPWGSKESDITEQLSSSMLLIGFTILGTLIYYDVFHRGGAKCFI